MTLAASTDKALISTTDLHYIIGSSEVRQYDACYYEINMDQTTDQNQIQALIGNDENELKVKFQLKEKQNVNVYIYGGKSREDAKVSLVSGNQQAEVNAIYDVDY